MTSGIVFTNSTELILPLKNVLLHINLNVMIYQVIILKGDYFMQIISLANKKGGVAKTTTAITLDCDLSKHNFHVLAIDWDAQANFSKASGGEDDVVGTFDILTGKENINEAIHRRR